MNKTNKVLFSILTLLFIFPFSFSSSSGALTEESQQCLTCHSDKNLTKKLANKEVLSLYVNSEDLSNSAHGLLNCADCHTDISMQNHPTEKKIQSRKEYAAEASKKCILCHTKEQMKGNPLHETVLKKTKTIACVECHGAHDMKNISQWKNKISSSSYCLTCHKNQFSKTLKSGETLSLSINEKAFNRGVHGTLTCTVCHRNFSKTDHPILNYNTAKEYAVKNSKPCVMCHAEKDLRKNPVHSSLMDKASCVECHGSHYIKGIATQKQTTKETQYCLSCHQRRLSMRMKNGERLSVYVDKAELQNSAHAGVDCTGCHSEFSKQAHPVRSFASIAEYSLKASASCKNCHADAYTKYEESVHSSALAAGNMKAPTCSGCHGSHNVMSTQLDTYIGLTSCNKCHGDMNASYEASIHYEARKQGNPEAPLCSSCHNAHDVESTKMTTKIKEGCITCHKDTAKIHSSWLKNPPITLSSFAKAHFEGVSCTACHSPGAKRVILLSLFSRKTGKPIPEEEVAEILDTDVSQLKGKFDLDQDGMIDGKELWSIFAALFKKDMSTTFVGKMDVSNSVEAHQIGAKSEAVSDCEKCHHPNAEFFQNVYVAMSKTGGGSTLMDAKRDSLNSIYSIIPVRTFYALGSMGIQLFDILFVVALLGGIAVPIGHITLRIITYPLRSMRRMGKGGKK